MKSSYEKKWEELLSQKKATPYVFRTRLERLLLQTISYANKIQNKKLENQCNDVRNKLEFISDQSNHTSDGVLRSYIVLEEDMNKILQEVKLCVV